MGAVNILPYLRSLWVQLSRPKNEFEEPKSYHIGNTKKQWHSLE